MSRICNTYTSNLSITQYRHRSLISRKTSSWLNGCSGWRRDVWRVSEGCRIQNASTNSTFPRWSDTFSVLLSLRCTSCSTVNWTCLWTGSLNRPLQVTSAGTTSRSVNHVFILSGGRRIFLHVRLDRGIDCLHTSPKLRQCPVSRTAWMPAGAPFSLTLLDPAPLIGFTYVIGFGAQVLLFIPVNLIWFDVKVIKLCCLKYTVLSRFISMTEDCNNITELWWKTSSRSKDRKLNQPERIRWIHLPIVRMLFQNLFLTLKIPRRIIVIVIIYRYR